MQVTWRHAIVGLFGSARVSRRYARKQIFVGLLVLASGGAGVNGQSGIITTVAGNGKCCFSGDGGPATSAAVWAPAGLAVDSSGNLYIVQENHNRVRMVTPDGIISTLAGGGGSGLGDGGPANKAQLSGPWGVAVDSSGECLHSRLR